MSENLKRAESLFNRIMNQSSTAGSPASNNNHQHHESNSNGPKNNQSHNSYHKSSSTSSNYNGNGNSNGSNSTNTNSSYSNGSKYKQNGHASNPTSNGAAVIPVSATLLPKRDPIKSSQETLSRIPENHHILPYCWTIWHHSRLRLKQKDAPAAIVATDDESATNGANAAAAVDSYLQTTNEIEFLSVNGEEKDSTSSSLATTKSIGSLEQLWMSLSSVKKTYELPIGTEFLIFKSGINPVWEDPINAKGGRWVFRFNRRSNGSSDDQESIARIRKRTSLIWERLVIKTITGSIIPESNNPAEYQDLLLNDISGLVLSVRKDEDIISIWNSNLSFSGKGSNKKDEEKTGTNKKLTSFQARRIICDAILRVIRECDLISQGSDCVDTIDSGSNERVFGVSFEYRLHADNANPDVGSGSYGSSKNGNGHHHHHHNSHHSHHSHHNHHSHNRRYNNSNKSYNATTAGGSAESDNS
ncbi:translation initiation factor 4F, cap-binding subunit and related cap-binding protein [Scheffersomyces xylosifermentans]|uniref:translation initiation factor 4F, cap-binding subunit and related cap-binding protein n=1 Tax=Scheffersomyces xylosifermentans TaxID=1304137 RepID=UPI00315C5C19